MLWWREEGEKRERDQRADLAPFFTVQSNLSSWRRWVKTNIVLLSGAWTEHTVLVKELGPLKTPTSATAEKIITPGKEYFEMERKLGAT